MFKNVCIKNKHKLLFVKLLTKVWTIKQVPQSLENFLNYGNYLLGLNKTIPIAFEKKVRQNDDILLFLRKDALYLFSKH